MRDGSRVQKALSARALTFELAHLALFLGQIRDQRLHVSPGSRMTPIRRDVLERNENEAALRHPRMRQLRRPRLDASVVIEKIEIERARCIALAPLSVERGLDIVKCREQFR